MVFKTTSSIKRPCSRAATLVEYVIAVGIAGLILAQVCLLWLYSSRSFAAQMNYADMDHASQRALDTLTQNIRQCKRLTSYAPNQLVFTDFDDKPLTFKFENNLLTRTKDVVTKTLLKDCQTGSFAIYQRNPTPGSFQHYPTTDPTLCKLVEVRWVCGRKLFPGAPSTTESMQSAKIVLRSN